LLHADEDVSALCSTTDPFTTAPRTADDSSSTIRTPNHHSKDDEPALLALFHTSHSDTLHPTSTDDADDQCSRRDALVAAIDDAPTDASDAPSHERSDAHHADSSTSTPFTTPRTKRMASRDTAPDGIMLTFTLLAWPTPSGSTADTTTSTWLPTVTPLAASAAPSSSRRTDTSGDATSDRTDDGDHTLPFRDRAPPDGMLHQLTLAFVSIQLPHSVPSVVRRTHHDTSRDSHGHRAPLTCTTQSAHDDAAPEHRVDHTSLAFTDTDTTSYGANSHDDAVASDRDAIAP
jgi:hypothetical protein